MNIITQIIILLTAPLLGLALGKLTKKEKPIFTSPQYFPTLFWICLIIGAVFLTLNRPIGLSLIYTAGTIFFWQRA